MREFYRPFNARLTKLLADERFTWEDVWKSHSQTSKAMRSRWGEDGGDNAPRNPFDHGRPPFEDQSHDGRIPAHHLHDPRFHDPRYRPDMRPDREEAERRREHWDRDKERFEREGGDFPLDDGGPRRRPPPDGRDGRDGIHALAFGRDGRDGPPGSPPPGGREGLLRLPTDMIQKDDGAVALCLASMGLHVDAMLRILDTPGVSATSKVRNDHMRTALHCLGSIWIYGDSLRDSYVFSLLSGGSHWLDKVLDPPATRGDASYGMSHVTRGAQKVVKSLAKILLDNGADPNAVDDSGRTPLHYAAIGGLESLAEALLAAGADPNMVEVRHRQTALHSCATHGHPSLAKLLVDHGARTDLRDAHGNTFMDIATAIGTSISPMDLQKHLGLSKVAQKSLPLESGLVAKSRFGSGGWNTELLPPKYSKDQTWGSETSSQYCDVDMLNASRTTPEELFEKYVMMNRPVLIRGLNLDSPGWEAYTSENLKKEYGDAQVHVSDIPYNQKFGSPNGVESSLEDYIHHMETHTLDGESEKEGENHPWYVFKGHPVPEMSDKQESLVNPLTIHIPDLMRDLFMKMPGNGRMPPPRREKRGLSKLFNRGNQQDMEEEKAMEETIMEEKERRRPFVNIQWALGTAGSGAPVHFHNTAWNQLFYGRKHWYLFPPATNLMGKKQVLDWLEHDVTGLIEQGFQPMECVQLQGDVLIVPELWGHAVLNVQESVAVASEVRGSSYRLELPRVYRDLAGGGGGGGGRGRPPRGRPPKGYPKGGRPPPPHPPPNWDRDR